MLRYLTRQGISKGVLGGSRAWFVVAVAAGLVRLARRLTREEPEVVFHEPLAAGETLVIRALEPE